MAIELLPREADVSVLEFDLADRLRRALRVSDVGVQEMADYLGVGRNTVSTWINGKIIPSKSTMRLFAMRTGVPLGWLETGCTPPDLNREPTDFGPAGGLVTRLPFGLELVAA